MNAFDNHKKKIMPQTDADKDTEVLLNEIKDFIVNPTYLAKVNELLFRIIKNGDPDDLEVGNLKTTEGAVRPKHSPLVP